MKQPWTTLITFGALFTAFTGFINPGIVAMDDYFLSIDRFIPATKTFEYVVQTESIRTYLGQVILLGISKFFLLLGVQSPVLQLQCVLAVVGLFTYLIVAIFSMRILLLLRPDTSNREQLLTWGVLTFYGVSPFFYSRVMFETLSIPFVVLFCYFWISYLKKEKLCALAWSFFFLTTGCLIRVQLGPLVALPLIHLLWKKRYPEFIKSCALLLGLFALSGLPDLFLLGEFHQRLRAYIHFNLTDSTYWSAPFHFFFLLILGLSLPPAFLYRWPSSVLTKLKALAPILWIMLLFTFTHSLISHKEERFLLPILPLLLLSFSPIVFDLWESKRNFRLAYFAGINLALCSLLLFNVPQSNAFYLAEFVNQHKEVQRLYSFDRELRLMPTVFFERTIHLKNFQTSEHLKSVMKSGDHVIIREDQLEGMNQEELAKLQKVFECPSGFLENIIIKLNPKFNKRRGTYHVYQSL